MASKIPSKVVNYFGLVEVSNLNVYSSSFVGLAVEVKRQAERRFGIAATNLAIKM